MAVVMPRLNSNASYASSKWGVLCGEAWHLSTLCQAPTWARHEAAKIANKNAHECTWSILNCSKLCAAALNEKTDGHHAGHWWFSNLMLQDVALRVDNADNASRQPTRHHSATSFFISKIHKKNTDPGGYDVRIMIFLWCSRPQTAAKKCSSTHP